MEKNESNKNSFSLEKEELICNLDYVTNMMSGSKQSIRKVMDCFLVEMPRELRNIKDAVENAEYTTIATCAHKTKSTASIMGISVLITILKDMENLAIAQTDIEKIKEMNEAVQRISEKALEEINRVKLEYE